MRSFQIPKMILPIALAATKAYIQTSGKTEVAPQGCVRQGIPGRDSNGQLPEGGFGLPLFHSILSGSAPPCLQNPRGLGWKTPVLITFYPQILRKSQLNQPKAGSFGYASVDKSIMNIRDRNITAGFFLDTGGEDIYPDSIARVKNNTSWEMPPDGEKRIYPVLRGRGLDIEAPETSIPW